MKILLILIALSSIFFSFGQKIEKELHLKHSVRQDGESYEFKVDKEGKKRILRYDKSKMYYWFKAQKVMSTQGGAAGVLLHGTFEAFYDNKQLARNGSFHKGLKNGEWLYWRPNGQLIMTENWKRGVKIGSEIHYNEKGIEIERITYKRFSTIKRTADSLIVLKHDGRKKSITVFDANGDVKGKVKFKHEKSVSSEGTNVSADKSKHDKKRKFFNFKKDKNKSSDGTNDNRVNPKSKKSKNADKTNDSSVKPKSDDSEKKKRFDFPFLQKLKKSATPKS